MKGQEARKVKKLKHFIKNPFTQMTYNSLQGSIFTTMIGFVTWPPFL